MVPGKLNAGARRPLRVPLQDAVATEVEAGVRLEFTLLKGSFATSVLRELLADAPWFGDGEDEAGNGPAVVGSGTIAQGADDEVGEQAVPRRRERPADLVLAGGGPAHLALVGTQASRYRPILAG